MVDRSTRLLDQHAGNLEIRRSLPQTVAGMNPRELRAEGLLDRLHHLPRCGAA